ncbi:MAG: hypothetical protein R3Y06_07945 [Faecalibacterium sp.]
MRGKNAERQGELFYVRMFSELGEYQQAHEVTYQLQKQAEGYLLEVQQLSAVLKMEKVILHLPKEQAEQVLTLLYENSVSVELCRDVLAELLPPCTIAV